MLTDEIVRFFQKQQFTIVSTVGRNRIPHNACKGIVEINRNGKIYILDLYKGRTYTNLRQNPYISITAVDEHKFKGWCLKGKADIIAGKKIKPHVIRAWGKRIAGRITQRVIKNMLEEKGHHRHPESQLPSPKYMILVSVEEIVDLSPSHVK